CEIRRFSCVGLRDARGLPIYTLNDLKTLQDYTIQRELLRVPRIAGVVAMGGTVKRFEILPDPDRLRQYGISLQQLQNAVASANTNGGGDNLSQGQTNLVVRALGLYGNGQDPSQRVLGMKDPAAAAAVLRAEEARRLREIRQTVVASVKHVPIRVDHLRD